MKALRASTVANMTMLSYLHIYNFFLSQTQSIKEMVHLKIIMLATC